MGRKAIYITDEERRAAHSKRSLKYYYTHREKCKTRRMEKYYAKKTNNG
jgi:lipoprotein NlpI